jgi:hypothetical protein
MAETDSPFPLPGDGPNRKASMTSISKTFATILVGAACCATGLTACGSETVTFGDKEFTKICTKDVKKKTKADAYAADICACEKKEMTKMGFGDKTGDEKSVAPKLKPVVEKCQAQAEAG